MSNSRSRLSQTENEIVETFLREQSYNYNGSNGTSDDKLGGGSGSYGSDDETALTEDIRKMARALAPQISELEDVLRDFTDTESAHALEEMTTSQSNSNANNTSRSMMEDEDDDLDDELTQLATSEQALREELEFAARISLLGSPSPIRNSIGNDNHNHLNSNSNSNNNSAVDLPSPVVLNAALNSQPQPQRLLSRAVEDHPVLPSSYTLKDHADYLQLKTERTGRWYYSDMTSKLMPTVMSGSSSSSIMAVSEDIVKDYCLPIPFRKLKRLYGGLVFHDVWENKRQRSAQQAQSSSSSSSSTTIATPIKTPSKNTIIGTPVVNKLLQTPAAANSATTPAPQATPGGFTMAVPATPATPATTTKTKTPSTTTNIAEKQIPSQTPLQNITNNNSNHNNNVEEPLPIRTISIRVRPDVLCGAIMDAANHAFEILPINSVRHIIKRQGGHLRGAVYMPQKQLAYVADIQLCTQKNDNLERRLLLRFYHIQDDPDALLELGQILQRQQQQQQQQQPPPSPQTLTTSTATATATAPASSFTTTASSLSDDYENNDVMAQERSVANRHLKQTCSLIQRLMAAEQQEGGIKKMDRKQQSSWMGLRNTPFDSKAAMQYAIGTHLESNYKSCPSVREENKKATPTIRRLTLPSLSKRDWPMLDVSWTLANHIVEELDTRDCSYNTLATLPFGQFPSLPTLDVQYCSQLRRLSRENMITHLLKSAKELEQYANLAEYNCAVCITLLDPMIEHYGVPALSLPTPKTLDEYPLEYAPPQITCPPWGGLVMEALNRVAAKTPTGDIDVIDSVRLIYRAFIRQDDEEQGARLGRKNAQIMERLANMQSHQRALVQNIRDSHVYSQLAAESASEFLKRCQQVSNKGKEGYPSILQKEVPLLDIKISLGASQSGRCFITARQILFVTSYIPLLGSVSSTVFDLNLIRFQVEANPTSTLLNPFPNTVNVVLKSSPKEVVYSCRPAMGPSRLQTFMTIIQGFAKENRPSEYSQVVDSNDEGILRLTETQSEEEQELSV